VIKQEDFSIAYLSADKTRRMKALLKSEEMKSGICSKCSVKANQYDFEGKFNCTICKDVESEGWVCQMYPLQHLICSYCHDLDNHREPLTSEQEYYLHQQLPQMYSGE
jgi:hypothetical protein